VRTIDELLSDLGVLAGLEAEQRRTIAGCARLQPFAPGELLMREGAPADEFFVIRAGDVALETEVPGRGAVTLETLHAGDVLGWSWIVPPYRTAFDARAIEATRVVAFDGACLRGKCEDDPALGFALLRLLAAAFTRRLQDTRMRLLDLYAGARDA
jgi:CRP/FNR family transcriptional regulator, cyclic AMP receptor protein